MNSKIFVAFIIATFAVCAYATEEKEEEIGCGGCFVKSVKVEPSGEDHNNWVRVIEPKKGELSHLDENCIMHVNKKQGIELLKPVKVKKVHVKVFKPLLIFNKGFTGEDFDKFKESKEGQSIQGTGLERLSGKDENPAGKYFPKVDTVDFSEYKDKMRAGQGTTKVEVTIELEGGEKFTVKSETNMECK